MKIKIVNSGKPKCIVFSAKSFETYGTDLFPGDELTLSLPGDIELSVTLSDPVCKIQ